MTKQIDAPNIPAVAKDAGAGLALVRDTQKNPTELTIPDAWTNKTAQPQSFLEITPLNGTRVNDKMMVAFNDGDEVKPQKPTKPSVEKTKEAASELATVMKTQFNMANLKDGDREQIHSAFNTHLAKSEGLEPAERAKSLRAFVDHLNTDLRKDQGKFSFREDTTGNANKLAFSLVDRGDGNLVSGLPQRTVYDTMEYALKKEEAVVKNMPSRDSIPGDLKEAFDYAHQQARSNVMKTIYGPALDAVIKDTKIHGLTDQKEINNRLGLKPDATSQDMMKDLEKRMMAKLGKPNEDYNQAYSQDVDRAFLKTLDLKPGVATTKDMEAALKKLKATVPKDFKRDVPPGP